MSEICISIDHTDCDDNSCCVSRETAYTTDACQEAQVVAYAICQTALALDYPPSTILNAIMAEAEGMLNSLRSDV